MSNLNFFDHVVNNHPGDNIEFRVIASCVKGEIVNHIEFKTVMKTGLLPFRKHRPNQRIVWVPVCECFGTRHYAVKKFEYQHKAIEFIDKLAAYAKAYTPPKVVYEITKSIK